MTMTIVIQTGVRAETCPSQTASSDHQGKEATSSEILGPQPVAIHLESQEPPSLKATLLTAAPCEPGNLPQSPGSRCAASLTGASPIGGLHEPLGRNSQVEDEVSSPSHFPSFQCLHVPWGLSNSSSTHADLSDPGVDCRHSSRKRGRSSDRPPAAKSKKRALTGGRASVAKTPRRRPGPGVSERLPVALEVACPSQPWKRKCVSLGTQRRKRRKRH